MSPGSISGRPEALGCGAGSCRSPTSARLVLAEDRRLQPAAELQALDERPDGSIDASRHLDLDAAQPAEDPAARLADRGLVEQRARRSAGRRRSGKTRLRVCTSKSGTSRREPTSARTRWPTGPWPRATLRGLVDVHLLCDLRPDAAAHRCRRRSETSDFSVASFAAPRRAPQPHREPGTLDAPVVRVEIRVDLVDRRAAPDRDRVDAVAGDIRSTQRSTGRRSCASSCHSISVSSSSRASIGCLPYGAVGPTARSAAAATSSSVSAPVVGS